MGWTFSCFLFLLFVQIADVAFEIPCVTFSYFTLSLLSSSLLRLQMGWVDVVLTVAVSRISITLRPCFFVLPPLLYLMLFLETNLVFHNNSDGLPCRALM